jgi:hypothetical protein
MIKPIETPFWIEKENFNFIIKCGIEFNFYRFYWSHWSIWKLRKLDGPIDKWWIAPQRRLDNELSILDKIWILRLSNESLSFLQNYYLNNVTHLLITEWNDHLTESIIKHIDCSRIKYIEVSKIKGENNQFFSLLSYTKNIISLRINLNLLFDHRFACLKNCSSIIYLDISVDQHRFDINILSIIGNLFPNVEQLTINTQELSNVPKLQDYLPRLRSLTFQVFGMTELIFIDNHEKKLLDYTVQRKAKFLFKRENNYITVWIDEGALQDPYWRPRDATNIIINNHSTSSTQQSWPAKIVRTILSLCRR